MRPVADATSAHRTRVHQCPETRLEGNEEWRATSFGRQRVRPLYHFRSEYALSAESHGSTIAVLELSTNDLHRIRAAATMIQSEVGAMKPGAYRGNHHSIIPPDLAMNESTPDRLKPVA